MSSSIAWPMIPTNSVDAPYSASMPRGVVVAVAVLADDVAVVQHVVALAVEAGDDADARQALGHVGEHTGDAVADAQVAAIGRRPEPQRQADQQRHDEQRA